MKKAKRAISILMCAALLLGLLPTAALAVTAEVSFQIRNYNGASGTVSYRFGDTDEFSTVELNQGETTTVANTNGAATITVKATPSGGYINQGNSGVYIGDSRAEAFNITEQTGEGTLTYTLTDASPQFKIEFDNNDGTGGGNGDPQDPPAVNPGDVKFEIGGDSGGGTLAYSIGNNTGWNDASNGMVISKNNLTGAATIYVKVTLNDGYQLDDYVDSGVSVNQVRTNGTAAPLNFTENVASFSYSAENTYEVTVRFMTTHGPSEGTDPGEGGGGTAPDPTNYAGAAAYIESWDLAYYGAGAEAVKTSMATELWNEEFSNYHGHTGAYTGMFADFTSFKNAIELTGDGTASENIWGKTLHYYTYAVTLHEGFVAEGKVYVLENAKQFGVKIGDSEYHLLDTTGLSGENVDLYVQSNSTDISNIKVFGNGVCSANLSLGSGDGWAAHISQDHSGLTGGSGCRLVVLPANYTGVKIEGDVKAAAWGFAEVPIFATGSDSPVAEIFYGNNGTEGRKVTISQIKDRKGNTFGPAITDIAVDGAQVNPDVATITSNDGTFTVAFNSGYDVIPLTVTYAGGSTRKLTIHRVGLHLEDNHVNGSTYQISHGTDKFVQYSTENAREVVTAAFYYSGYTGETKPSEHISLFVTVNTTTGTTRKVVTRLNSDFIATTGNDKWADDFLLWSGTDEEYANLISISAIAYSAGIDGNFGGVKVGSGTGVTWKSEVH